MQYPRLCLILSGIGLSSLSVVIRGALRDCVLVHEVTLYNLTQTLWKILFRAAIMGTGSKVISVILRLGELCSAVIVTALIGRFFYLLIAAPDGDANSRLIYAEVISCLQILFSIVLILPFKYSFFAWPLDLINFILSMVAFGLLADVSITEIEDAHLIDV